MSIDKITILDGGMGTMLQAAGLAPGEHPETFGFERPETVREVHRKYIEAGTRILYANTFGGNPRKLAGQPIDTKTAVTSAIQTAREAAEEGTEKFGQKVSVALDVGPIGELLEPLGTVTFEDAYDAYKETVIAGAEAGADLIVFETFTDLLDAKAAVLAAKENSDLPVWVTMTFEESGRTFTGTALGAFAMTMEGLGVEAVGINCSLGPVEILPLARELAEWTNLPLIIKPNAGLPDPETGEYRLSPEDFASQMMDYKDLPLIAMGGCCGTNPDYIRDLCQALDQGNVDRVAFGENPVTDINRNRKAARHGICSSTDICEFGGVRVIGERLNPTGKKKFQAALLDHDMDYICKIALAEEEAGADKLLVGTCRDGDPVAAAPGREAVPGKRQGVIHVAADIDITVLQRLAVAVEEVELPGNERDGAGPVEPIAVGGGIVITPAAGGYDVRQQAVGLLLIAMIGKPLLVHGKGVVVVESGFYGNVGIRRPAVFLPLGTVGGVSGEVGPVGAAGGLPKFTDYA